MAARAKKSGRYTYSADRACECGRPLRHHDAEAPHGFGDLSLDDGEGRPDCDAFRPAK